MRRAGFTLIELMITLAILALASATVISSINSVTSANLRSKAVELTGAIKMNYDRSVMLKRAQRIAFNVDSGTWWVEFSEERFAVSKDRLEGEAGDTGEGDEDEDDGFFDDEIDQSVKKAMNISKGSTFTRDDELEAGKPQPLGDGVCFSRIWTGHQEEPFRSGIAYLHFWPGGWTEDARIELVEANCDEKTDVHPDDTDYITLRIMPLTGRVRSYHRRMKEVDVDEPDGRDEGDL